MSYGQYHCKDPYYGWDDHHIVSIDHGSYEKTMKINIFIHDNGSTILFKPRKYKKIYGKMIINYVINIGDV